MDGILLSHLAAHISLSETDVDDDSSPIYTFLSLLPGPDMTLPPTCMQKPALPAERLSALFSRFGNNNFAIHSHLTTYGHGIFPLASRLFNHSCMPNAAVKYFISRSQPVRMEVVALRDISANEEVLGSPYSPCYLLTHRTIDMFTLPRSRSLANETADFRTKLRVQVHVHLMYLS